MKTAQNYAFSSEGSNIFLGRKAVFRSSEVTSSAGQGCLVSTTTGDLFVEGWLLTLSTVYHLWLALLLLDIFMFGMGCGKRVFRALGGLRREQWGKGWPGFQSPQQTDSWQDPTHSSPTVRSLSQSMALKLRTFKLDMTQQLVKILQSEKGLCNNSFSNYYLRCANT